MSKTMENNNSKINLIKNIWRMLEYCVNYAEQLDLGKVDFEDIHGLAEFLAVLLCITYEDLINTELETYFNPVENVSSTPYGRLDILKSYRTGVIHQGMLVCNSYTESINSIYNQIIKAAFEILRNYNNKRVEALTIELRNRGIEEKIIKLLTLENDKGLGKLKEAISVLSGDEVEFILSDIISKKTIERMENNLLTLNDVDEVELTTELVDQVIDVPDRYKYIWTVIRIILFMLIPWDKGDKTQNLLELNNEEKISGIFEKFGLNFAKLEYQNAEASNPSYRTYDENGNIDEINRLDLLLKNDTNMCIVDFKFYDRTDIEKAKADNKNQMYRYTGLFIGSKDDRNEYATIKSVLIYANKNNIQDNVNNEPGAIFSGLQKDAKNYRRTLDLSQEKFEYIKKNLTKIYDEMLCIPNTSI